LSSHYLIAVALKNVINYLKKDPLKIKSFYIFVSNIAKVFININVAVAPSGANGTLDDPLTHFAPPALNDLKKFNQNLFAVIVMKNLKIHLLNNATLASKRHLKNV